MSIRSFLQVVKKQVEGGLKPLRFVTGNQSADLDSVISALGYSYLNYRYDSTVMIPMINIPRQDFKLRRDIKFVLENNSITEDLLYFIEDFKVIAGDDNVEIILVDHCNIQGETLIEQTKNGKVTVIGIIDHHADEQVFMDANPRIIISNGSCSSLVFNYWFKKINDVEIFRQDNGQIVKLLIAPLLIDTSNLTEKVEQNDIIAFETYESILEPEFRTMSFADHFTGFYKQVKQAKKDLTGFKFNEVLRKDYKQFNFKGMNVGFSSMGKSAYWTFKTYSNQEILDGIDNVMNTFELDLLLATPSHTDNSGQYRREMFVIYNKDSKHIDVFNTFDLLLSSLKLNNDIYNLEKFEQRLKALNEAKVIRLHNQSNLAASRKQIVPAVKEVLEA